MGRAQSESEASFNNGLDTRPGVLADNLKSMRELVNAIITEDKNIARRPPCLRVNGLRSAFAQGMVLNGGKYYTIARRGDAMMHTGDVATLLTTLYFDPPENTGSTWTIVLSTLKVFEGRVCCFIVHQFPGVAITSRLYFHTWDLLTNVPTYSSDPSGPWDWGPSGFPTNAYGNGTGSNGAWKPFLPQTEAAAEKLWPSRVDANTAFSGIARPRIYNSRSADTIEKEGTEYYFTVPASGAAGMTTYAFPEVYADFADLTKFAGYVVEVSQADGTWLKLTEVFIAPAAGQWQLTSATRAWSSVPVGQINLGITTPDALIRIRIVTVPAVTVTAGGVITPGPEIYKGDGATVQWPSTVPFSSFASYQVLVNGAVKSTPAYYAVTNNNGLARVDFRDFAQVVSGGVSQLLLTPGSAYTTLPTWVVAGGGGAGASVTTASLAFVAGGGIAAAGAAYTTGDIVTLVGGTFSVAATLQVTAAAGNVTAFTVVNPGVYTVVPGASVAVTGGTGAGFQVNRNFGVGAVTIVPGSGYTSAPTATPSGGSALLTLQVLSPVGLTTIPFTAATDGDFGRITVYFNGIRQTEGSTYTLSNVSGNVQVLPSAPLAAGTTLNARLVIPTGIVLEFLAAGVVLSAATITYELASQTSAVLISASLLPSDTAYVGIAANGSLNHISTAAGTPLTGLQRYQLRIVGTVTTDGGGNVTATAPFAYGSDALSTWYNQRHLANLDYWSGENEAGFINTSTHDTSGSGVTGLMAIKNRMAVFYQESTQLWQVDADPVNNAFIDRYAFGTRYAAANFYNRPLIYTQRGFRAFDLQGLNFQSLEDVNVGEPLQYLGGFQVSSATFWPWHGSYAAWTTITGTKEYATKAGLPPDSIFYQDTIAGITILSFSKESAISAWSFNPVVGLTAVEAVIADDERLYLVQGQSIYYLDSLATAFRDATDPVGQPAYQTSVNWHLWNFGNTSGSLRMLHVDLAQVGKSTARCSTTPWRPQYEAKGPTTLGITVGMKRVPLRVNGRAFALHLLTTDESGWNLQSLSYEFIPCRR